MVQHTKETTHINGCYDIYQTNKEAYQSCSKFRINHDKPSTFQEDCSDKYSPISAALDNKNRSTAFLKNTRTYFKHKMEYLCIVT